MKAPIKPTTANTLSQSITRDPHCSVPSGQVPDQIIGMRAHEGNMGVNSLLLFGAMIMANAGMASPPTVRDIIGAPPVVPIENEPPARLFVDPPVPEALAKGRVYIQYRAENLRFVQVFGPGALTVSPRIGHVHVTVDNLPWHWADASGEQIILTGLLPGPHTVLIELVNANHRTIDEKLVAFTVPVKAIPAGHE